MAITVNTDYFIDVSGWYLIAGFKDLSINTIVQQYVNPNNYDFEVLNAFVVKDNHDGNVGKAPGYFIVTDWLDISNNDLSQNLGVWTNIKITPKSRGIESILGTSNYILSNNETGDYHANENKANYVGKLFTDISLNADTSNNSCTIYYLYKTWYDIYTLNVVPSQNPVYTISAENISYTGNNISNDISYSIVYSDGNSGTGQTHSVSFVSTSKKFTKDFYIVTLFITPDPSINELYFSIAEPIKANKSYNVGFYNEDNNTPTVVITLHKISLIGLNSTSFYDYSSNMIKISQPSSDGSILGYSW